MYMYQLSSFVVILQEFARNVSTFSRVMCQIFQSMRQAWCRVVTFNNMSTVVLWSDNAGCYHCSNLWHSLHGISQRTGKSLQLFILHNKKYVIFLAMLRRGVLVSNAISPSAFICSFERIFAPEFQNNTVHKQAVYLETYLIT